MVAACIGAAPANKILYSYDGITWAAAPSANNIFPTYNWCVRWNGTQWLAGGSSSTPIAYSSDGINWTGSSSSYSVFGGDVRAIGWNGTKWLAASGGILGSSSDGITWTQVTTLNINIHTIKEDQG
jgi:hypothetical protein